MNLFKLLFNIYPSKCIIRHTFHHEEHEEIR
jgi:hypothetical protein